MEASEKILPGSAERFMRILEAETVDRSKRADRLADEEVKSSKIDRRWAIRFILLFTSLSVFFFALGNPIAGVTMLAPPVLGMVRMMWPVFTSTSKGGPKGISQSADGEGA